jgi:hypothetical protein
MSQPKKTEQRFRTSGHFSIALDFTQTHKSQQAIEQLRQRVAILPIADSMHERYPGDV